MAKTEEQIIGEDFEAEVKRVLDELKKKHPLFYHRFPDTKAARGFIAAQPSDFLVAASGLSWLLEVKASGKHNSLAKCAKSMIRPQQLGMSKAWTRAGSQSLFLFYGLEDNMVELWDGKYVTDRISEGSRLEYLKFLRRFDYFELEDQLKRFFLDDNC